MFVLLLFAELAMGFGWIFMIVFVIWKAHHEDKVQRQKNEDFDRAMKEATPRKVLGKTVGVDLPQWYYDKYGIS